MEEYPQAIDLDSNESLNLYDDRNRRSSKDYCSTNKVVEGLKRMVKLIVVSLVLALFFSLFSLFPHSFNVYFSSFLLSILNDAMERKYMFLICNGILFLLATSSVIEDSSSSFSFGTCSFPNSHQHHHDHFEHDHLVAAIDHESDSEESEQQNQEEEEEIYRGELEEDKGCFTDEEVEEEEEGEEEKRRELEIVVSTEELNKKIEEFIRKMKEEMRIEAAKLTSLLCNNNPCQLMHA